MSTELPRISPVISATSELKRMSPPRRSGSIRPDDVSVRSGNVVFSFGFPGSGKTTFQWFLMNYLMNQGDFSTEIVIPDTEEGGDWAGRVLINSWKELWIEGRFPEATKVNEEDIKEVRCKVVPGSGNKTQLDFSFLEVSGELLKAAVPEEGRRPDMVPTLRAYLKNPRMKLILVLLLHPDREENDIFFPSLISFLDREFPNVRDRMSLAIVLSKPQESLERLRSFGSSDGRFDYDRLDADAIEDYVNRFCGETFQIYQKWPDPQKTLLAPLYIGEVAVHDGEKRLVSADFKHVSQIFAWVYGQFTSTNLGKTWFQRFIGGMSFK